MDLSTIKTIVNLSLLGVFILIVLIIGLSALVGYKKGAFKVSYKLLFMLVLFLTAIFTLTPEFKAFKINGAYSKTALFRCIKIVFSICSMYIQALIVLMFLLLA